MDLRRRWFLESGIAAFSGTAVAQSFDPQKRSSANALFARHERFPIWPAGVPGRPARAIVPHWTNNGASNRELWVRGVPFPEVHVFRPAVPDGSSILVFPGGGYEFLSVQNEGLDPAQRFTSTGSLVFILTYRLPNEGWPKRSIVALQDAQRAMRLIRAHAPRLGIDATKIGVLGFSAGGHLAADLCVSHDEALYTPVDAADRLSARPAFAGLVYPVISLDPRVSLGSSATNLLGPDPSSSQLAARSPALRINSNTPPSFLVAAFDDPLELIENSLTWIDGCRRAKVRVEAHLLSSGGHGFGLHLPRDTSGSLWPDLFARWMHSL